MRCVILDKFLHEPIDFGCRESTPFGSERAFDHRSRAAAHQVPRGIVRHRRQAFLGEHGIERGDKIGRTVNQRSVEIEDNCRSPHHPRWLAAESRNSKAWLGAYFAGETGYAAPSRGVR